MSITRYNPTIEDFGDGPEACCKESHVGEFVKFSALSSLQAKHDRLKGALERFIEVTESGVPGGMTNMNELETRLDAMERIILAREGARQALADEVTDERAALKVPHDPTPPDEGK